MLKGGGDIYPACGKSQLKWRDDDDDNDDEDDDKYDVDDDDDDDQDDDDVNTFYSIENFVIRENQRIVNNQNDNNQNMEKFMWERKRQGVSEGKRERERE